MSRDRNLSLGVEGSKFKEKDAVEYDCKPYRVVGVYKNGEVFYYDLEDAVGERVHDVHQNSLQATNVH